MKKCVLLFCFLILLDSCISYDFLKDSVSVDSTFPSILFVQVESPTYKGYAVITDILLRYYYSKYDTSIHNMFEERIYNDIKRNITFLEKDSIDAILFIPLYSFDSTYYTIADKGIETFIQTYFESNHPSIKDTSFYRWQIAKIMFDAGIHIRMSEDWQVLYIDDPRFYTTKKNGRPYHSFSYPEVQERRVYSEKFVIPKSYIQKGKNWYKNTWQKQFQKNIYFQNNDSIKSDRNY